MSNLLYKDKAYLRQALRSGQSIQDIAKKHGVCDATIYRYLKEHNIRARYHSWSKKDDNILLMNAYDIPHSELAKKIGVPIRMIRWRIRKLGLGWEKLVGYTTLLFARDAGISLVQAKTLIRSRKYQYRKVSKFIELDYNDICDWLASGHIFALPDITKACSEFQDIYRDAQERFITTPELHYISSVGSYTLTSRPPHIMQVDTGYIYDRAAIADFLAVNIHLVYRYATGSYVELIRKKSRQYILGSTIEQYNESVYRSLWYAIKQNSFPTPIRYRPNVWQREPVITWLQAHVSNPKWAALLEYLYSVSADNEE